MKGNHDVDGLVCKYVQKNISNCMYSVHNTPLILAARLTLFRFAWLFASKMTICCFISFYLITMKMICFIFKQVFDIGKGEHCPITGIEFHKVPNTTRYIVLVSTVNRLYKFHETLRFDDKPPYLQVSNSTNKKTKLNGKI